MLRGDNHIGCTKQGVAPGGEDGQHVALGSIEVDLRTGGTADPVLLLSDHAGQEVHGVQTVDQLLGVIGDLQHPLALLLADNGGAAALTDAVHDLLIGQHAFAGGAPVHGHAGLIGQTFLEQLEEDPLRPLIVAGIGGVDLAIPVKGIAQHFQLLAEVMDVVLRHLGRVDVHLDGVVLCGQTERIIADGEQHIVTVHALLAGDDIHCGIGTGVTHMETLSGGIGELHQTVPLLAGGVTGHGVEGIGLLPALLPFLLNGGKIVLHFLSRFLIRLLSQTGRRNYSSSTR